MADYADSGNNGRQQEQVPGGGQKTAIFRFRFALLSVSLNQRNPRNLRIDIFVELFSLLERIRTSLADFPR